MGSIAIEKDQIRTDSLSTVKATISCIDDESIPVDAVPSERIEALESCNHFSIRGYVAEVRKRNKKLCFPFCTSDGGNESLVDLYELPPLDVPKFRWWECDGCLGESDSDKSDEVLDIHNDLSSDPNHIPTSSPGSVVAPAPVSPFKGMGHVPELKTRERWKLEPGASSHDNQKCASSCSNLRGKALDYGVNDNSDREILEPASDGVQLDVLLQDRQDDYAVALDSQLNNVIESQLLIRGSKRPGEAGLAAGEKINISGVPGRSQSGVQASNSPQSRDILTARVDADVAEQTGDGTRGRLVPLPDLNMCDDDSLGNDDEVLVNNPCDDDDNDGDDLSGGSRPKIRKMRLLSELLGVTEYRNVEHVTRRNDCPVGFSDGSTRKGKSLLSTDLREGLINNDGTSHVTRQKKRRAFSDGGYRPLEMKGSVEWTKRLKKVGVDEENTEQSTEDSSTESDEDASVGIVSQSIANRNNSLVRNHELEKKTKKAKWENGHSSVAPRQKTAAKVTLSKTSSADKQYSLATDCGRRMDQLVKSCVMVQPMEKSPMYKKRKANQRVKDQSSFFPGKNFAPRQCSVVNHGEFQPRNDAFAGKAMRHSHNPCVPVEIDLPHTFRSDDWPALWVAMQRLKITDGKVSENRNASSKTHCNTTAFASPVSSHVQMNRQKSTNQKSNPKGKKNMFPEAEPDGLSWLEKENMVSPEIQKKGMTDEQRRRRQDIDINAMPTDDKAAEQRPLDEVPMDIVELMAKHQHERQVSFQKDKHFMSAPDAYPKYARPRDRSCNSHSYGLRPTGTSNLWQNNFPVIQRPLGSSGRNGALSGFYDSPSVKQKPSVGLFPEVSKAYRNPGHYNETRFPGMFDGSDRHKEHVLSDLRFSSLSLTCHNGIGRTPAHMYPYGSVQGLEPLNWYPPPSQQNQRNHVWATTLPKFPPQGTLPPFSGEQKVYQDNGHLSPWKQDTNAELKVQYSSAVQLLKMMHSGDPKAHPSNVPYSMERSLDIVRCPAPRPNQPCRPYPAQQDFSRHNHGAKSMYPSLDNDRRNPYPQKMPHPCYSGMPNVGPFPSRFHNEACVRSSPVPTNHVSFASRGQADAVNSTLRKKRCQRDVQSFPYWVDCSKRVVSSASKGKGVMGPPSCVVASSFVVKPLHGTKEFTNQNRPGTGAILPTPQTEVCLVNRNPAELDQNLAKKYMVEGEILRPVMWSEADSSGAKAATKRAERIQRLAATKERKT